MPPFFFISLSSNKFGVSNSSIPPLENWFEIDNIIFWALFGNFLIHLSFLYTNESLRSINVIGLTENVKLDKTSNKSQSLSFSSSCNNKIEDGPSGKFSNKTFLCSGEIQIFLRLSKFFILSINDVVISFL